MGTVPVSTAHVLGHDGGIKGYESFLRVVPEARTAVVLLSNGGGNAQMVFHSMFAPLLREVCAIRIPPPPLLDQRGPLPPGPVPAATPGLAGTYDCGTWRLCISDERPPQTRAVLHLKDLVADEMGTTSLNLEIHPISNGRFAVSNAGERGGCWLLYLLELPSGTRHVHMWRRAAREVGS